MSERGTCARQQTGPRRQPASSEAEGFRIPMSYDVVVTKIDTARAKSVIARHLAQAPEISLQKAQYMVNHPPVVYQRGVTEPQLKQIVPRLKQMGATVKLIRVDEQKPAPAAPPPQQEPPAQPAPPPPPPAPPRKLSAEFHSRAQHVAGSLDSSSTNNKRKKRTSSERAAITAILVLVAIVLLSLVGNKVEFNFGRIFGGASGSGDAAGKGAREAGTQDSAAAERQASPRDTTQTSPRRRARSNALVDSAKAYGFDQLRAIKFYKMALSFNRNNIKAWHGLLGAYTETGMTEKASRTRREMKSRFGEEALSITEIVKRYGEVDNLSRRPNGTYRVEYRSSARDEESLIEETYQLARELRTVCRCSALSVYASTGKGRGLLSHVSLTPFPATRSEYRRTATMRYLE